MILGIIVAMDKELNLLLPLIEEVDTPVEINGFTFYAGKAGKHGVVVMKCGIGKVNAAIGAMTMIDNYKPSCVINSGVAGGADPSMHVLDLFIADAVAYHDVWCGPGTEYGAASGFDVLFRASSRILELASSLKELANARIGLICSGDKFISKESEINEIKSHFPDALAVDMESAAIAQVCVMKNVPFNIIRVISDTPGQEENISQYSNFWHDAPRETFAALCAIIEKI